MGAEPEPEPGPPSPPEPASGPKAGSMPRKICLVCGDRALGYNFNVISCESCKAFFRRNALTGKEFKCPFANACEVTVVTRRFCQRCRLEKCLAVGMVKEFIMSEEDKARKREKIEENRAKKRGARDDAVSSSRDELSSEPKSSRLESVQCEALSTTSGPPDAAGFYLGSFPGLEVTPPEHPAPLAPPDDKAAVLGSHGAPPHIISVVCGGEGMLTTESAAPCGAAPCGSAPCAAAPCGAAPCGAAPCGAAPCGAAPCGAPSVPFDAKTEWDADPGYDPFGSEATSMESILCEAIRLEFEAQAPPPPPAGGSRALNAAERAKLDELVAANAALHAPLDEDVSALAAAAPAPRGTHDPDLINIVNLTAVAIRRLIKMAKKISAFRDLCEEDQVALLKGGCIEMMVLRSTMNYDGQQNSWRLPYSDSRYGTVPADVLKKAKGNIYQAHERFIRSFEPRWRQDERVVLLLSAISLFTPERARVVHADVVRLERHAYYHLLRRYLESVHPGCEAKATFLRLLRKVRELRRFAEEVTGVYLDVNPLEPLLIEIFDLKHRAPL